MKTLVKAAAYGTGREMERKKGAADPRGTTPVQTRAKEGRCTIAQLAGRPAPPRAAACSRFEEDGRTKPSWPSGQPPPPIRGGQTSSPCTGGRRAAAATVRRRVAQRGGAETNGPYQLNNRASAAQDSIRPARPPLKGRGAHIPPPFLLRMRDGPQLHEGHYTKPLAEGEGEGRRSGHVLQRPHAAGRRRHAALLLDRHNGRPDGKRWSGYLR